MRRRLVLFSCKIVKQKKKGADCVVASNMTAKKKVLLASAFTDSPSEISRITGVPISTVCKYLKNNSDTVKEYRDMRDQVDTLQIKDAIEEISDNMMSFILAASKAVKDPAKMEKASLKDIMTATGIAMDKFPGLFKKGNAREAGSSSAEPGIVIQIVDNSLPKSEITSEGGDDNV